jgi:DUF3048 family protein
MTRSSRPRRVAAATAAVVALLALAACTGNGSKKKSAASTPPSTSGSSTPAPSSAPAAKPAARNPLTGVGPVPTTPVIAVKMDDTAPGRPQVGIDKADVAYIEAVEGGLTRLAVVFGTNKPVVGYVRSTRPSDPDLLLQYGKITEAYSGGARVSLAIRRKSGLTGWSNDGGDAYYERVSRSESTYINLQLNLAKLARKTKTNRPKSNGWTFNASLAGLPAKAATDVRTVVTGSYASGTPVEFRYDAKLKKYIRYIDGVRQHAADGNAIGGTNVIVQSCRVATYSADKDVNGNPAQFTYTVGSGPVSVFRQGKRIDGTWTRSTTSAGTTLRTTAGKPLTLAPGNTWVVLVRKGIAVHS